MTTLKRAFILKNRAYLTAPWCHLFKYKQPFLPPFFFKCLWKGFISLSVDHTNLWVEPAWVIKINQRKLLFKCPPQYRHKHLLLLRVFGKYLHHEHLFPLLVGRKEVQQFLEILINLGAEIPQVISWLHFGNYWAIYANIFDAITQGLSGIT